MNLECLYSMYLFTLFTKSLKDSESPGDNTYGMMKNVQGDEEITTWYTSFNYMQYFTRNLLFQL